MFEEFSREEYDVRVARTREAMQQRGIDALLTTTELNGRYLAGIVNTYWVATMADDIQAALIPAQGDSVLLLPDHLCHGAGRSSWIEDRRAWSQFSAGLMPGPVKMIAEAIAQKGLDKARIGMEVGRDSRLGMSLPYLGALQNALPEVEFVDCDEMMAEVRATKSEAEIACIRRACELTCEGMLAGIDAVAEGVSEHEIGQAIARRWMELTDDLSSTRPFFLFIYSSPHRCSWFDCGPSDYRLQKGDWVVIDIGYCYKGYWGDMFRTCCIGEPTAIADRFFHGNRAANLAGIDSIAPGVQAGAVAQTVVDHWKQNGFEREAHEQIVEHDYDFVGHGGGLSLHDHPLLSTQQTRKLTPGMYLMMEGMLTDKMPFGAAKACLGIEEGVLVTDTGHEVLTEMAPNHLFIK